MEFKFKTYVSNPFATLKMYNLFSKTEHWSREIINDYAFKKLKDLCIYCEKHVPYYQKLFKEIDFYPEKMETFSDYKKIPIMNKDTVREKSADLQSDEIKKMNTILQATSGSTGTPLKIYLDYNVNRAVLCKQCHFYDQSEKWHIGKTILAMGDTEDYLNEGWHYNPRNRFLYLTPLFVNKNNIKACYELIKKYNPTIVQGYPSAIYLLGKNLEEAGLSVKFDTVFTNSENLLEVQKNFFERFFGARVAVLWGNNEKAGLIYSCKSNNLHSQDDYAFHEIVDQSGNDVLPGQEGRLVCTNLYNYSMPLLRYDTRDLAVFSNDTCSCGSSFKTIQRITGRASEVIYTADGTGIPVIDTAFWETEHIDLASLYQSEKGKVIVNIVPSSQFSDQDEESLIAGIKEKCGEEMQVKIMKVKESDIPRSRTGKVKFVVSDIKM